MFFRKAVLVVHGFSSGTWENEYLINYLKYYDDLDVYAFTLPGHCKEVVEKVKYQEWIDASEKELKKLISKYKTIYIVGHSMGGVIATYLASKYKEVKKLVLLAPSFEYLNIKQNADDFKKLKFKSKYEEEIYKELFPKLFQIPISVINEFRKLVKEYKKRTLDIACDTLILYGEADELIPYKSIEYAYETISSKQKHVTIIKDVKHRILISNRKEEVSKYISDYLKGGRRWKLAKKSEL